MNFDVQTGSELSLNKDSALSFFKVCNHNLKKVESGSETDHNIRIRNPVTQDMDTFFYIRKDKYLKG